MYFVRMILMISEALWFIWLIGPLQRQGLLRREKTPWNHEHLKRQLRESAAAPVESISSKYSKCSECTIDPQIFQPSKPPCCTFRCLPPSRSFARRQCAASEGAARYKTETPWDVLSSMPTSKHLSYMPVPIRSVSRC